MQRRHGRGTARHTVCHNTIVHPADVKRFAELGVIANCTLLWGTDYDGSFSTPTSQSWALSEWRNASIPTATLSAPGHW